MNTALNRRVNLKSVALPAEHGGWGFLLEPILLGLLVAPSWAGALLCMAMVGIFLEHQPVKIALKDWLKRRRTPRTIWAEWFILIYGVLALAPLLGVLLTADPTFLIPLLLALPLMLVQLYFDAGNDSRDLLAELCGSSALGAVAAAVALLDGWELHPSLLLWAILLARTIPSIFYVRARLRLERGKPADARSSWAAHGIALGSITGLALADQLPLLTILASAVLFARALWGLSAYRTPAARAAIIGVQEMIWGFLNVIIAAIGYS